MFIYADTSALVKLVSSEAETAALRQWLAQTRPALISSDLTRTEIQRAVRRAAPERMVATRAVLESIALRQVGTETFEAAAHLDPLELRSLNAIHLASALELGDELAGILTYDERLAAAARRFGIRALSPGAASGA